MREPVTLSHFDDQLFGMDTAGTFKNPQLAAFLSVRQNLRYQHYPTAVWTIPLYE
jgi:hypothetical protein